MYYRSHMQCVVVKQAVRCTNDSVSIPGVTLPLIKQEAIVFMCVVCIDEMQFVAHQSEKGIDTIVGRTQ